MKHYSCELIVTQWDVNKGTLEREAGIKTELIVTQWDVNLSRILQHISI